MKWADLLWVLVLVLASTVTPLFAQALSRSSPSSALTASDARAQKVIDDAIAALGGDAFLNMEDRVESGRAYSFYNDRLSGLSIAKIYTRYITVAAGRTGQDLGVRERQAFGKNEDSATVLREDGGAVAPDGEAPRSFPPINSIAIAIRLCTAFSTSCASVCTNRD